MMISLSDGGYINSDTVRLMCFARVGPKDSPGIRLSSPERDYFSYADVHEVASLINSTIVKADPGYMLLTSATSMDDEWWCSKEAIIAWKITGMPGALSIPGPVTLNNSESDNNPHAILCPDGTVLIQYDRQYDTLAAWEAEAREAWATNYQRVLEIEAAKKKA